ncbi:unnamed protein product [Medioppia subpectinata]|uniref:Uncharacterized protein n=1 Tax=Medioppia subpectinata TaxID=1979941 RepID=A0A7R9L7E5_9ACAR|nr:unnamed protein product [Medioppia subpectinata]CAG2116557.1 unnamed protein product [Medioppia subpectinata]
MILYSHVRSPIKWTGNSDIRLKITLIYEQTSELDNIKRPETKKCFYCAKNTEADVHHQFNRWFRWRFYSDREMESTVKRVLSLTNPKNSILKLSIKRDEK